MNQASEQFFTEHFALWCLFKSADTISTDENSLYVEYSQVNPNIFRKVEQYVTGDTGVA